MNKCGLSKKVQIELFFSPICTIFAENRRYLGITAKEAWRFCSQFALSLQKIGYISA